MPENRRKDERSRSDEWKEEDDRHDDRSDHREDRASRHSDDRKRRAHGSTSHRDRDQEPPLSAMEAMLVKVLDKKLDEKLDKNNDKIVERVKYQVHKELAPVISSVQGCEARLTSLEEENNSFKESVAELEKKVAGFGNVSKSSWEVGPRACPPVDSAPAPLRGFDRVVDRSVIKVTTLRKAKVELEKIQDAVNVLLDEKGWEHDI